MRPTDLLDELVRHAEWADATVWQTVLDTVGGESQTLDSKVEFWLHHIHLVQHAFANLWRGEPPEFRKIGDFTDPQALARWGREGHAEVQQYLSAVADGELARELEIPWTEQLTERLNRPIGPVSVSQSVTQVAMHSTHHRGQVASRLRETGAEPPMIDYIAWVWFGQPEAEWPPAGRP